jgi:hypothetical protein
MRRSLWITGSRPVVLHRDIELGWGCISQFEACAMRPSLAPVFYGLSLLVIFGFAYLIVRM